MIEDRMNQCVVCGVKFAPEESTEWKMARDIFHIERIHTTCMPEWESGTRAIPSMTS